MPQFNPSKRFASATAAGWICTYGIVLALAWSTGCEKVPTFQELTQGEKDAEPPVPPPVTPKEQTGTPATNEQTPDASKPNPQEVLAEISTLKPTQFTNQHLIELASLGEEHLHEVTSLDLERSQVDDAGLAELEKLPNLQELNLSQTKVSPGGMAAVSRVGTLTSLSLHGLPGEGTTQNFDQGLAHLAGSPNLRSLDLTGMRLTDAGLEPISRLPRLERLRLDRTAITDAGLVHVGRLITLKELGLNFTSTSDAGFEHLQSLTNLEHIEVGFTRTNGMGFQFFPNGSRSGLKYINASDTQFAINGFQFIKGSQTLEVLILHKAGVSDLGMKVISGMRNLRVLNVSANGNAVTDRGVVLLKTLKELEQLDLHELPNVTDAGVGALVATRSRKPLLPKLHELNLAGTGCTDGLAQAIDAAWKEADLQDINVIAGSGRVH